jgi:AraC family transcriptional regulator
MSMALAYVEDNLAGDIDPERIAQIACCSANNFYRMFSYITETSLTEYIRRRRLTLAAIELQANNAKVIDLAMKYGYDSPVSFSRAFQTLHGVTPTEARAGGVTLKAYPRISFRITIKGEKEMKFRIETKDAFQVFGIEHTFNNDGSGAYPNEPHELWEHAQTDGSYDRLLAASGDPPGQLCRIHALCDYKSTEPNTWPYMLCAFKDPSSNTEGFSIVDIPAHTWAVFPSERFAWDKCPDICGMLHKRFFTEWLPTAEYEWANDMHFEIYGGDEEMGYIELWYPVKKKQ